jgi:hypothetical protein
MRSNVITRLLAALLLCAIGMIGQQSSPRSSTATAQSQGAKNNEKKASATKMNHAHGTFNVKITPQKPDNPVSEAAKLGRMTIDKEFHGDMQGTSKGEMLFSKSEEIKDSGVYVAIERVTASIGGRNGSFVLHHTGIMDHGQQKLTITVAPDSGTDGLNGITGTMNIKIDPDGKHFYDFDYELPAQ